MDIDLLPKGPVRTSKHHKETYDLLDRIKLLLEANRMSVRQVFYSLAVDRLIPFDVVPLNDSGYRKIQRICDDGRLEGYLPYDRIVDRSRFAVQLDMWSSTSDFYNSMLGKYRRNIWDSQPNYFEIWLEKAALYDIFYDVIYEHGILLLTTRGYASLSVIQERSLVFQKKIDEGKKCKILYFGDHDPSGIQIDKSIRRTFKELKCNVEVIRVGLIYEDIKKYNLPTNVAKDKDNNLDNYHMAGFEEQAELDALPVGILKQRILDTVVANLDMDMYGIHFALEKLDREAIVQDLKGIIDRRNFLGEDDSDVESDDNDSDNDI